MKKTLISISLKITIKLLEFILILQIIFNFSFNAVLLFASVLLILIIILDNLFLSTIVFKDKIIIINKFNKIKLDYSKVKKITIHLNPRVKVFFGTSFKCSFELYDDSVKTYEIGPIFRENKVLNELKKIMKLKCVKMNLIQE